MARFRIFLHLVLLTLLSMTSLAYGARSSIVNDTLIVPRVDIDGYGAMQLSFAINYEGQYYFDLNEAVEASLSVDNAGSFDPVLMEIEVFEIELDNGELYSARLVMVPDGDGNRFSLAEALQLDANGSPVNPPPASNEEARSLYLSLCASCHGDTGQGTAAASTLIACANCSNGSLLANYINATMPLGNPGGCDMNCAQLLSGFIISDLNNSNEEVAGQTVGFIKTLSATDTVRKAAMKLVSRFPTVSEFQSATNEDDSGLEQVVNALMQEDAFYNRLTEIFNDYLLTDKYHSSNGSEAAVRLIDKDDFPSVRWFDPDSENRAENYETVRRMTNDGLAREPLELINYVVRNNRPFTEIVTADYLMVNPFSAKSYGLQSVNFQNPDNYNEFQPARLDGTPHAGILTSPMFLNRYPTTSTNRNRGRARVVYDLFLDTDILAIEGVRPGNAVDITTPIPTIDNPECSKCHSVLDPVASVFQNWDYKGRYRPARLDRYGWYPDMEPRGFNGQIMPLSGNIDSSVQWLGQQIAQDPKFPRAIMRIMLRGLTGKEPLRAPAADASKEENDAYIAERTLLNDIQNKFISDNYNLKTLVREILLSPYWRADGLTENANSLAHLNTGAQYLLSPEQLDRKIEALLGFQWRGTMDNYHSEINKYWASGLNYRYHQIYGGIDSDSVTTRLTSPNGLMGAMQLRMANELSCYAVPQEFMANVEQRKLFPFVDSTTSPYDELGNLSEENMQLIRQNIQYLHDYLLGEYYQLQQGELQVTEDLFMYTLNKGRQTMLASGGHWTTVQLPAYCKRSKDLQGNSLKPDGGEDNRLIEDRNHVMRSWMAVLAYLFADYRFLYE